MGNNSGDLVEWDTETGGEGLGITIGNNVTLQGAADVDLNGSGDGPELGDSEINIGGFLKIASNVGALVDGDLFTLDLDDVNVGGTTILAFSGADDDIQVTDCRFARRVEASLGGGDDEVEVEDCSFAAEVVANGGNGDDLLDAGVDNEFAVAPVVNGFETVII
jgi:hypothetical protein